MMNWDGCEFVESVPGRMSGVPVVVGSRVPPETVLVYFDDGFSVGQIAWNFGLPKAKIRGVLAFAGRTLEAAA